MRGSGTSSWRWHRVMGTPIIAACVLTATLVTNAFCAAIPSTPAGHCIYTKPNGGWANSIDVYCTVSLTGTDTATLAGLVDWMHSNCKHHHMWLQPAMTQHPR